MTTRTKATRAELLGRAKWLEERLDQLPENKVSFLTDRKAWEAERVAFRAGLTEIELAVEELDPPGRFGVSGGAETLSMMGVRATSTQGDAALLRAWIRRARLAVEKAA